MTGNSNGARNRLLLGTAMLGTMILGYGRRAYADCVENPLGSGTYACSNTTSANQNLAAATLTVTTNPGFSISTSPGPTDAFDLHGLNGDLTFTDNNNSTITGGAGGMLVNNGGTGAMSITTTGTVTGATGMGIYAENSKSSKGMTISAASVYGQDAGIRAMNTGSEGLSITTTGSVGSTANSGILAWNYHGGLSVSAAAVSGKDYGIKTTNSGGGDLSITTSGKVVGSTSAGIYAGNSGAGKLTVNAAAVYGGKYGVRGQNLSTNSGDLSITTSGIVNSSAGYGIWGKGYGSGATVTIQTEKDVTGAAGGVYGVSKGSGLFSITTSGTVTGTSGNGITGKAYGAGGLTIKAQADVTGGKYGVYASNTGTGAMSITATGTVTGQGRFGVLGNNSSGTDLTINTATVYGTNGGVGGYNQGTGTLSITTTGLVKSTGGYGLAAIGGRYGHDVMIRAASVYGEQDGVHARQYGSGQLYIKTTGTVTGATGSGIVAAARYGSGSTIKAYGPVTGWRQGISAVFGGSDQDGEPSGALTITAGGKVTGTRYSGIYAVNYGTGSTSITVTSNGVVQGGAAGVAALSRYNSARIIIINNGVIQNTSGESSSLAIAAAGGSVEVVNNGTLTGVVDFRASGPTPPDPSVINAGIWNTAGGTNTFTGSSDTVTNTATGRIYAAAAGASSPVTTTFANLGTFTNAGLISMHNGVTGDQTVINANFVGSGGTVSLDTALGGDASPTDQLAINGNASGSTGLLVYNAGGLGGQTTKGIEVVAITGTSTATAFSLAAPVEAGAYTYKLVEGANNGGGGDPNWYLSSGLSPTPPAPPAPPTPPTPSPAPPVVLLPDYRNEVPVYLAIPELANALGFAMIDSYDARMGGGRDVFAPLPPTAPVVACSSLTPAEAKKAIRSGTGCATPAYRAEIESEQRAASDAAVRFAMMWGRAFGATGDQHPGGDPSLSFSTPFLNGKGPEFSASYGGFQAGVDLWRRIGADGSRDNAGLYVGYINATADVEQVYSPARAGTIDMNAYSGGAYWTHVGPQGWYVDGVLQGTWFGQVKGATPLTGMTVSGSAFTASIEAADPFRVAANWSIEPQAQLIYQYLGMNSGSDAYGETSFGGTNDVRARIGGKLSYASLASGPSGSMLPVTVWGRVNVWHDFLGSAPSATFATLAGLNPTTLEGTLGGTWGQIDAGVNAQVTKSVSLFGSAFYDHSIGGGASWSAGGRIGVKAEF